MIDVEFSDRGLAPHKFMPMLGVHKALQPTPKSGAAEFNRYALFIVPKDSCEH
jgi:hypothetical protein